MTSFLKYLLCIHGEEFRSSKLHGSNFTLSFRCYNSLPVAVFCLAHQINKTKQRHTPQTPTHPVGISRCDLFRK